jgi:hypothetical protein
MYNWEIEKMEMANGIYLDRNSRLASAFIGQDLMALYSCSMLDYPSLVIETKFNLDYF